MSSIFVDLFGSWYNALIFMIIFFTVMFLIAYFQRIYALMKIFLVLTILMIYETLLTPLFLDILCGDPLNNTFNLVLSLNASLINPTGGFLIYSQTTKPLADYRDFFSLIFYFVGIIIGALIFARTGKQILKKDEKYRSQNTKNQYK